MSSYGLWLSAAGMKVNEHKLTLLANNLANAQTTGFKRDLAVVLERPVESREGPGFTFPFSHPVFDGIGGGVNVRPTFHNLGQGPVESTGRPLDVALEGDGFFGVSNGTEKRYTRDGVFAINRKGDLVLAAGGGRWKVLDEEGSAIRLDPSGKAVSIGEDGAIRQGREIVARLGRFKAGDNSSLKKVGENLFSAGDEKMTPANARLIPESREESNVDVMSGLATMIEASRAYQLNATMIQMQDQMFGQVSSMGRPA